MKAPRKPTGTLDAAWREFDAGRTVEALEMVAETFRLVGWWTEAGQRLPIGWPEADRLIAAAAERVRAQAPAAASGGTQGGCDAVLIARWSPTGGHVAVAADMLRASRAPAKRAFVIHCNPRVAAPDTMAGRLGLAPEEVEFCPEAGTRQPWEWLPGRVAACGCSRLFVFHETRRPEVLVAALASAAAKKFVVHHVDGKPCSGLHVAGAMVIELTPYGWHYSRVHLGIDPAYAPLTSRTPPGERPAFLATGELRTATCGRAAKFDPRTPFRYSEVIAERLRRFGGRHLHIGPLSPEARAAIDGELSRRGVALDRFEYLASVPDLPEALWAHRIDLYISSFPYGGARTTIDVMASATPAIAYLRSGHTRFGSTSLAGAGTAFWSLPDELWEILRGVDAAWLAARSRMTREHFERHHSPALLAQAFARPDCSGAEPPPLGPDDRLPEPYDMLGHLLADVASLGHRQAAILDRLAALEAAAGARAPRKSRPWWRRWFGQRGRG